VTEKTAKCEKCGALLINVVSGALCPKGCGKLYPLLTNEQNRVAVRRMRLLKFPLAKACNHVRAACIIRTAGQVGTVIYWLTEAGLRVPGIWRRIKRASQSLNKHRDGATVAYDVDQDRVVELIPFTAAEQEMGLVREMMDKAAEA